MRPSCKIESHMMGCDQGIDICSSKETKISCELYQGEQEGALSEGSIIHTTFILSDDDKLGLDSVIEPAR